MRIPKYRRHSSGLAFVEFRGHLLTAVQNCGGGRPSFAALGWNDGLEGIALEIAETNSTPLRVTAGPGTGKSFAMKRRVARLLESGVAPESVLAVTFTRNAASALLDDLHQLGIEGCEEIRCCTLHSFCFRLLAKQAVLEYLGRTPRPLIHFSSHGVAQFEASPLLSDIEGFGSRRDCTTRILAFEAAWARLQSDDPL